MVLLESGRSFSVTLIHKFPSIHCERQIPKSSLFSFKCALSTLFFSHQVIDKWGARRQWPASRSRPLVFFSSVLGSFSRHLFFFYLNIFFYFIVVISWAYLIFERFFLLLAKFLVIVERIGNFFYRSSKYSQDPLWIRHKWPDDSARTVRCWQSISLRFFFCSDEF